MSRKLVVALIAAIAGAGCSSATAPMLSCDENPKCKADAQPAVPAALHLEPASGSSYTVSVEPRSAKRFK
jgi:hypothetical protein